MKGLPFLRPLKLPAAVCGLVSALLPCACGGKTETMAAVPVSTQTAAGFTYYTCEIVRRYPHDSSAFTQGLLFWNEDTLLESTGMHGRSSLRRVEIKTGRVLEKVDLPQRYFGEGLALLKGKLYQLTWKDRRGFIYDAETLKQEGEFPYTGEGWGLTTDGISLILSDGTNQLRFLDPLTFAVTRTLSVMHQGKPVDHLNELEFIDGQIYSNIWGTDLIARIDPATGLSTGVIDCSGLFPANQRATPDQVLNGIAWHEPTKRLLITGKWWPEVFEIKLKPRP